MKLAKYQKNKKKNKVSILLLVCILLLGALLEKSYASYQQRKNLEVINGNIEYFGNSDVYFAFYNGEKQLTSMPKKGNEENLFFDYGICDKGAQVEWDYNKWGPVVTNLTQSKTKCTLYFKKQYRDAILNGADPELKAPLIPVKINADGRVTRANEEEQWYKYENQEWANAVILVEGASDPGVNQSIPEANIQSYFVWIPRYRYQIFDEGVYTGLTTKTKKEQEINVVFENNETSAKFEQVKEGWLTHPAFTAFDTNGIWVGKFETGYNGAESAATAQVNPSSEANAKEESQNVIIKPNVYSWRAIQIANMYTISLNYKTELNSHMMKNTEWGAVAYLQHSKYGSKQKIRINNNSDYLTGYAGKHNPTTGFTGTNISCTTTPGACNEYGGSLQGQDGEVTTQYFNKASVIASTTNNYTGIFDMSGGAWEYMMAGIDDGSGQLASGRNNVYNSGFNGNLTCPTCADAGYNPQITSITNGTPLPSDLKYYDKYSYNTSSTTYQRRILGDATGELGPFQTIQYGTQSRQVSSWYEEEGWLVFSNITWVMRGGVSFYGTGAGIFLFTYAFGSAASDIGFRITLAF